MAYESAPRRIALIVVLTLVQSGIPPAIIWVGKTLVDSVVAGAVPAVRRFIMLEVLLVLSLFVVQRSTMFLRQRLGARLGHDVNVKILEKALTLDLTDFETPAFYDQLTRARREASSRPMLVVTETLDIGRSILTLSGYAVLLFSYSPLACLALAIASVPATLAERYFGKLAFRMRNWRSPDTRRLMYLERVMASDDHAKEVKILGIGSLLLERYKTLGARIIEEDAALLGRRTRWGTLLSLLATGVYYGVYATMVFAATEGAITLGEMTLYAAAFRQGQQSFESVLTTLGGMHEHALYLSNLFGYLDRAVTTGRGVAAPIDSTVEAQVGLSLQAVSFRYPGAQSFAVRNLSLDVPPGKSLALVGFNGAGKSTTLKAISGVIDSEDGRVSGGSITFDGRPIQGHDPATVVRGGLVHVMEGRRVLQHMTVEQNLIIGGHMFPSAQAMRQAMDSVYEAIPRLAELRKRTAGYLSGGEQQMLVIGRAIMAEPKLMLIDEPSLGLAPRMVEEVFSVLRHLREQGLSLLIVEQNTRVALEIADYGYVMESGRIVLEGQAQELRDNEDVREFYLGLDREGVRKSFREVKHYKRRKRWLG